MYFSVVNTFNGSQSHPEISLCSCMQGNLPIEYVFLSIENSNLHERTNPIKNNSIDPQETHVATHNQP